MLASSTTITSPLRVAIVGLGGFAASHHRALLQLEATGLCRVVGTCDPAPDNFQDSRAEWNFATRGIKVFNDYRVMLDALEGELDVVTVPAPVPLHAPIHQACVERGLDCYLEKPPTLSWGEMEMMLEVEESAHFATNVGFNFIVESARQDLKQRILAGEFGALRRVSFLGHWPRLTSYFSRAPWAGKIRLDGRLVLDSCIGNAMAHYIHNLLFWAGTRELFDWASVSSVEAQLCHTYNIENYDTVFARGKLDNNVEFRIAATHAGKPPQFQREIIECDHATITYDTSSNWRIMWRDGRTEQETLKEHNLLVKNFKTYFDYLTGRESRPPTTLLESRPFVHLINLIQIAGSRNNSGLIHDVPEEFIEREGDMVAIRDILAAEEHFINSGSFPEKQSWMGNRGQATADEVAELENMLV